jgi:hypothetical protein
VERVFGSVDTSHSTDCNICFDELEQGTAGTCTSCNNRFHTSCIEQFKVARQQQGLSQTCAVCRSPWVEAAPTVKEDGVFVVAHPLGPKVRSNKSLH